jgi:aryl-alcohol dehydrogenase-like predicted oxidoreductase
MADTFTIGGLRVSRLGFGAMRLTDEQYRRLS